MALINKFVAIADEVRTLSGITEKMTLDEIASYTNEANAEVVTQEELIQQIKIALQGKVAAGNGEGVVNIYDSEQNPVERGTISSTTGEDSTSSTRLRTSGYIEVKPSHVYRVSSNIARVYVIQFDSNYEVVGTGAWKNSPYLFVSHDSCAYIRITLSNVGNTSITMSNFEWLKVELCSIGGGTSIPTQEKTIDITENGVVEVVPDKDYVLSKVTANVNVPITEGYIKPSGTLQITGNGTHEVNGNEFVNVDVPIPSGYIKPSGTLEVTENGTFDVTEKASVVVSVPEREIVLKDIEITENGTYTAGDGYDGLGRVTVKVASSVGNNGILPIGYTSVPSIKFTGTQAVKTGIICNQDTQIRAVFIADAEKGMYIYGVTNDANTASITGYRSSVGGYWRFGNQRITLTTPADESMVWGVKVNKSRVLRGNVSSAYSGVSNFTCERDMMLGGREVTTGSIEQETLFEGKIIAFDLYDGEELVLSYVPCMDANGVCGFWDTVSKRFVTSSAEPLEWSYV